MSDDRKSKRYTVPGGKPEDQPEDHPEDHPEDQPAPPPEDQPEAQENVHSRDYTDPGQIEVKTSDYLYDEDMEIVGDTADGSREDDDLVKDGRAIKDIFKDRRKTEAVISVNYGSGWMVTFTDLVALMLTFFVLLYSMSVMEEKNWRNLVDSLSSNLKIEKVVVEPLPAKSLTLEPVDFIPGEDLDYLTNLIEEKLKDDPDLSKALLTRLEDRLVISLPADILFLSGQIKPREKAETVLIRLGRMLSFIDNNVEIAGHADPDLASVEGSAYMNWSLSLARADYVAGLLEKSGYKSTILSRGYGDSRYGDITDRLSETMRNKLARRVDIIVHLYAGESG